jgi:hypothetical protein
VDQAQAAGGPDLGPLAEEHEEDGDVGLGRRPAVAVDEGGAAVGVELEADGPVVAADGEGAGRDVAAPVQAVPGDFERVRALLRHRRADRPRPRPRPRRCRHLVSGAGDQNGGGNLSFVSCVGNI